MMSQARGVSIPARSLLTINGKFNGVDKLPYWTVLVKDGPCVLPYWLALG